MASNIESLADAFGINTTQTQRAKTTTALRRIEKEC